MKKVLLSLCFILGSFLITYGQSIHGLAFQDIDGGSVSLQSYGGKKILFIIAPINDYDSSRIREIGSFKALYGDSISIIGIMSIEDGFVDSNKVNIKQLYQSRNIPILLTAGMYTKKSSVASQSPLMHWLTSITENRRSDMDASGINQKFFIDKLGKMLSMIIAPVSLISIPVKKTMEIKQ